MRILISLFLVSLGVLASAAAPIPLEEKKIDHLIASIEFLQNAQFIRNGVAYEAKAAAAEYERWRERLHPYPCELLHGRIPGPRATASRHCAARWSRQPLRALIRSTGRCDQGRGKRIFRCRSLQFWAAT